MAKNGRYALIFTNAVLNKSHATTRNRTAKEQRERKRETTTRGVELRTGSTGPMAKTIPTRSVSATRRSAQANLAHHKRGSARLALALKTMDWQRSNSGNRRTRHILLQRHPPAQLFCTHTLTCVRARYDQLQANYPSLTPWKTDNHL